MFGHFWLGARPTGDAERVMYIVAENGWIGVDLFFVLSGFLITRILLNAKGESGYFRKFYARRALRIFPLYYGFLFAWFFVVPNVVQLAPNGPFQWGRDTQLWFWTYTSNWLSITNRVVPHGLNHFWSLAIEEQFYLVWPALVLLVSRRTLRLICLALLPIGFLFRVWLMTTPYAHTGGYVLTPARMGTLAVGAWLACVLADGRDGKKVHRFAPAVLFTSAALLLLLNLDDFHMEGFETSMQTIGFPLLAIAAAAILVLAMNRAGSESWYQRLFRARLLKFFGKYSYGMYVLHLPVVVAFEGIGFTIAALPRIGGSDLFAAMMFSVAALSATTLLAFLSWHLFEKRFLLLKSRFQ